MFPCVYLMFPGPSRSLQHHWPPWQPVSVRGWRPQVVPHWHICEERRGWAQLRCSRCSRPDNPDGFCGQIKWSVRDHIILCFWEHLIGCFFTLYLFKLLFPLHQFCWKSSIYFWRKLKLFSCCGVFIVTVLSINEYTPFEKYHIKQYLNEHKNNFQNVEYIQV